jgi:hypothetical protein
MFLIDSSLFKNGREIIFHYVKVINSSLIRPPFFERRARVFKICYKNSLQIYFLKKKPPKLFMSLRDNIMFSGSENKWGRFAVSTAYPSNIYCKKFERNTVFYMSYIQFASDLLSL